MLPDIRELTRKTRERFLEYVMHDTMSVENQDKVPSTEGQIAFAKELYKELKEIGIEDVQLDEKGYIYGYIPSNIQNNVPTIGFIAHIDTADAHPSPVKIPRVIENYNGDTITLESGIKIESKDDENLKRAIGCDLIVTDGKTLLGGDDKAGVAEIITALEYLTEEENLPHGKVAFSFTPDEEIGTSQDNFDTTKFGADFAYTVDGADFGEIQYENFYGASAEIIVKGISTHPGEAKNKMKNASLIAMEFDNLLPPWERPEHTDGKEGFYHLLEINGDCEACTLSYIIRDHDLKNYELKKNYMKKAGEIINEKYGADTLLLKIKDGYRNMAPMIEPHMELIDFAIDAIKECDGEVLLTPIRGGTDGSELSYKGVPCPNLGTGSFNHHSLSEVANINHMGKTTQVILKIIEKYSKL